MALENNFTLAAQNDGESYSVSVFYDDFVCPALEKDIDLSKTDAYEMLFSSGDIQARNFFRAFNLPMFSSLESVDTLLMAKKLDGWENENQSLNKRIPEKCEAISCVVNILKGIVRYEEVLSKIYQYMEDFLWKSMDSAILDKCRDGKLEISAMGDLKNIAEKTGLSSVRGFDEKLRQRIDDVFCRLRAVNGSLPEKLEIVDSRRSLKKKIRLPKKIFVLVGTVVVLTLLSPFLFEGIVRLWFSVDELSHASSVKTMLKETDEAKLDYLISLFNKALDVNDEMLLELDDDTGGIYFSDAYFILIDFFIERIADFHERNHDRVGFSVGSHKWVNWMWFNRNNRYPDSYDVSEQRLTQCPFCIAIDYKFRNGEKEYVTDISETYLYRYVVIPVLLDDLNVILGQTDSFALKKILSVGEEAYDEEDFLSRYVYRECFQPVINDYLERRK